MQKKILFVYTNFSTFVRTDFDILSEVHQVTKYQYQPVKGLVKNAREFTRQFFYLLFNIWRFDAVFIWFADYHSFLPVLFARIASRKSFVVIGGYDVAKIPEWEYGVFTNRLRGFCAAFSMRACSLNLAVSRYVERKVRRIAPKNKIKLIYNCVNLQDKHQEKIEKENLVITVGLIDSKRSYVLKGIDTFVETARLLPEIQFMIIGMSDETQKALLPEKPENLKIAGLVKHEDLVTYYKKAKVYCQLSRSESFGVAVVEAITFGCVPIVTNVGGLPELVNDKNLIVKRNSNEIKNKVNLLLTAKSTTELNGFKTNPATSFHFNERKEQIRNTIKNRI